MTRRTRRFIASSPPSASVRADAVCTQRRHSQLAHAPRAASGLAWAKSLLAHMTQYARLPARPPARSLPGRVRVFPPETTSKQLG